MKMLSLKDRGKRDLFLVTFLDGPMCIAFHRTPDPSQSFFYDFSKSKGRRDIGALYSSQSMSPSPGRKEGRRATSGHKLCLVDQIHPNFEPQN